MSIQINRLLNDFQQCLAELAVVSGGSYAPPAGVIETMREAAGKVDGLDSAQLVAQSSAAAGARRDKGDGFRTVLDALSAGPGMQLAGGAIEELLQRFQSDHEADQIASQEFADGAQNCGNAVDDIRDSSELGLSEILGSVIPVVQIVTRLIRLHPVRRLGGMIGTLASMVSEPAVSAFMRVVGDRDDAISGCYEEFLRRCEQLCEKDLVDPPATEPEAPGDHGGGGDALAPIDCDCPPSGDMPGGGATEPAQHSAKKMHTDKHLAQPQPEQPQNKQQQMLHSQQIQAETQAQSVQNKHCETAPPAKPGSEASTQPAGQSEGKVQSSSSMKTGLSGKIAQAQAQVCESPTTTPSMAEKPEAEACEPREQREPCEQPSQKAQPPQAVEQPAEPTQSAEPTQPEPEFQPEGQPAEAPPTRLASSVQNNCDIDICCIGQMAIAGLGMAVIGAQLIIETATQCLEQIECEAPQPPVPEEPAPAPEPQPEPRPEPDCPPEEKPAPQPQPEPRPEPVSEPIPEPDDEVIERPMPEHSVDKKQFHSGPAQVGPEAAPQPQPDPQPAPPAEQGPPSAPAPAQEPAAPQPTPGNQEEPGAKPKEAAPGNTHRMGQW